MLENFVYSINATMPVFILIVIGYIIKKAGWVSEGFIKGCNKFNFMVSLPALLINDMMNTDFRQEFELRYILFCVGVTLVTFLGTWFVTKLLMKDKTIVGEFVQGACRSSAAVLGLAFVLNIYGDTSVVPIMIIGSVPLYNILSVIILTVECPEKLDESKSRFKETIKGIVTNPIIISIVMGVIISLCKVDFPTIVDKTITNLATMAAPLALITIGASFEFGKALKKIKPTIVATAFKVFGWSIMFLPIAVMIGFRDAKLMALVVMLGSPSTPSCYIMAKNMKHEGTLTSSLVALTTLCSALTITAAVFVLRTLGYL